MSHLSKILALLFSLLVGVVSMPAWAANTLLSSQKLTLAGDDLRLELEFNQPMNFLSYFPKQRGTQLAIRMRPILTVSAAGKNQTIKDELLVERRKDNPVRGVTYEQDSSGNGLLTVQFTAEVQFVVEPVRDQRIINIILVNAAHGSRPTATGKTTDFDLPVYVINLQTQPQPINADAQPMLKNFRPKYAIYTITSSRSGETQYQLRLGYFNSKKLAAENVRRLKPFYPYAWVDWVTPQYRKRAENWFLQQGVGSTSSTQNFRVKETTIAAQAPSTTSAANKASDTAIAAGTRPAKLTTPVITSSTTTPATTTTPTAPPTGTTTAAGTATVAAATSGTSAAAKEVPTPSTDSDTDSKLMTTAKQAIVDKDYRKASSYLTHILQDPNSTEHQEAQELLGLTYERRGVLAQARAEYEKYLKSYPTGPDADRVKQRLDGLLTAKSAPVGKLKSTTTSAANGAAPGWHFFGGLSQYLRFQQFSTDITDTQTTDNSLSTGLVISGRNRGTVWDQRFDFAGNYFYNFLDKTTPNSSSKASIYSMFYDLSDKSDDVSMRFGRQSHSSDGVLTRFDGVTANKRIGLHEKLSLLAGYPVDFTYSDSVNTDRVFYAVSMKFESLLIKNLDTKFYFMHQTNNGLTDREAVGNETQYIGDHLTMYFMYDYDVHYKQTNLATFIGNWRTADNSSYNITADFRNSPLLTTSNALIGQSVTTLEQLQQTFTLSEVEQLAQDRTGVYRSLSLSATKPLSPRYQLNGNVIVSSLDGTPASGGVAATPATGNLYSYYLTLIANNLLVDNDVAVLGARYYTDVAADTVGLNLSDRFSISPHWSINPRMSIDMRSGDDGSKRIRLSPRINTQWRPSRSWQLEMEFGYQFTNYTGSATNTAMPSYKENNYYGYLGYNYNF